MPGVFNTLKYQFRGSYLTEEEFNGAKAAELQFWVQPEQFSDWTKLHAFLQECFSYMDGRIDPPSSLTRMSAETLRVKAGEEILILAYHHHRLVACGFLKETTDSIYLGKLAVEAAYRRRGILRSIVDIAEQLARKGRKSALELQARIELVENHKTFKAVGFVQTDETSHTGYERPTSITMKKYL